MPKDIKYLSKRRRNQMLNKELQNDTYSEIPTAWLLANGNKQLCWWPPRTANAAMLIASCASPNFDLWNRYEVHIAKYCDSLESARKSAANDNYHTTDDELLGRGKRQHVSYNRYSSEEENSDNSVYQTNKGKKKVISTKAKLSAIPSCPDKLILKNVSNYNENVDVPNVYDMRNTNESSQLSHEKSKDSSMRHDKVRLVHISDMPIVHEELPSSIEMHEEAEQDSDIRKYLKQIIRMQATTNLILSDIKERVSRLEAAMKSRGLIANKVDDTLIAQFLPLDSIKHIEEFESLLKNTDEAVIQFKDYLLKIGGNNPRDNIHSTLSKIFKNECAINCSWKGVRKNFKISDLYFVKIMKREITSQHSSMTETDFENTVAEWLRFAKQRKQRAEKGKQNQQEESNEEI